MTVSRPLALSELGQSTLRQLTRAWFAFERRLALVPIVRRLDLGTFTLADYQQLLLHLRPQVVEGDGSARRFVVGHQELVRLRFLVLGWREVRRQEAGQEREQWIRQLSDRGPIHYPDHP